MNDVDRWIYFGGPAPQSVQPFVDALGEGEAALPSPEDKARVMRAFFASFDERIAQASEQPAERGRRSDVYEVPPPPAAEHAALSFETWAELSIGLIGALPEEALAALGARGLTLEAWARLDDDYLRALSADLLAGRTERPALYAAKCKAEMARRRKAGAPPSEAASAPALSIVRAPDRLRGTAESVDLPAAVRAAMGKLPFKAPDAAPPAPAAGAARTLKVRAMSGLGETLPIDSDAIQKAVAAVPFAGSTGDAGVVAFPELTVKQYVSLRADLALRPDQASETLRRYGVPNEAARHALEAHWQERLAASAELRAQRDAAVATYASWLRGESG